MSQNEMVARVATALILFLLAVMFGRWWISEAGEEILSAMAWLLLVVVASGVAASLTGLVYALWHLYHRAVADRATARKLMAEARRAERDARHTVVIANGDQQVYIAEEDHQLAWRAAHRDPRVYANGVWSEPDGVELGAYLAYLESIQPRIEGRVVDQLLEPPQPVYLMSELADIERALIVGNSGSGKTTLLQHIIAGRRGDVVVIDPHDDQNTWPGNAQVIGGGQDYDEIERALLDLVGQVHDRYQERSTGQAGAFGLLTVIVDEWREIVGNSKHAADSIKTVLTGGRKVATCCIVATHSERARPLGIEGEADLKDGFVIVRLLGDKKRGFSATLDTGEGEVPVLLPGPYVPGLPPAAERPRIAQPGRAELPMSAQERQILATWDRGQRSVTKIGALVYGTKGGQQNALVRDVLAKFGRV